jgi:RNA polymerase sigma-70 factor (ECF subfamily)
MTFTMETGLGSEDVLTGSLAGLAATGPELILGLVAGGPRSGILRVSRVHDADFEARLTASYERHYPSFVSYARRHGAVSAEDVVQQAFEKVWQRRLRPAEIDNIDAYVQTAVRHETWRELARARTDRERYGGDPADVGDRPDGGAADQVLDRVTLRRFLDRLPRREREAVVLRMVWDLSVREAAESMGVSDGAVKRYCADGLHRLSDWLRTA